MNSIGQNIMKHTDSGGIQKEAYMLGVPCVTMRENTEWVKTVEDGWNVLVGVDYGKIVDSIEGFEGAGSRSDIFGSGNASERVCEVLTLSDPNHSLTTSSHGSLNSQNELSQFE